MFIFYSLLLIIVIALNNYLDILLFIRVYKICKNKVELRI